MKVQVLVAAMNQNNHELLNKMNICSDVIVGNQGTKNKIESFKYKQNNVKYLNFCEKGVGLNRNNCLMRACDDIVLFADEDEKLVDNYEQIIIDEFNSNSKADMIIFNVVSSNDSRKQYQIKKKKRIHWFNCAKYGAVRIAVKLEKIREKNIYFSLLFGGGAKYSNGEDSLFIMNCIKSGMKVYTSTKTIGMVSQENSTWFNGYDKKYFVDRGILYKQLYGCLYSLASIAFLIKIKKHYNKYISFNQALKYMIFCNKYEVR